MKKNVVLWGFVVMGFVLMVGFQNCAPSKFANVNDQSSVAADSPVDQAPTEKAHNEIQTIGGFKEPSGIAAEASGNHVYVADTLHNRIAKCVAEQDGACTYFDAASSQFGIASIWHPNGLALSADEKYLYIVDGTWGSSYDPVLADSHNRVVRCPVTVFNNVPSGLCRAYGSNGGGFGNTAVGYFRYPRSVAVDANGNVYVSDNSNSRVQKCPGTIFDEPSTGNCMGYGLGRINTPYGPGVFAFSSIAVDLKAGVFYVANANQQVPQICPLTLLNPVPVGTCTNFGTFNTGPGSFLMNGGFPGVAVNKEGVLFFTMVNQAQITRCDPKLGMASCANYSSKPYAGFGPALGQFSSPPAIAVDAKNNVYVADLGNDRIQILPAKVFP